MGRKVFEVWENDDGVVMFPRDTKQRELHLGTNARLLRTFEASSLHEAFATHHRLMGWEEWKPEPDWVDEPFE